MVKQLLGDESLCCTESGEKILKLCEVFLQVISDVRNSTNVISFSNWICTELTAIVKCASVKTLNRDKLWSAFHQLRSSEKFRKKWEEFLTWCKMPTCPLFYQHFTAKLLEHIKHQIPTVSETSCESQPSELTYEEQNAVRYVAGYVIKSVRHLKSPWDDDLISALKDLCNNDDDTIEPAESKEWLCSVDRGGLTRVTDDAYTCFCAIEYCVRRHFQVSNLRKMNDSFKSPHKHLMMTSSFTSVFCLET